ncbi:uncharacterized protein LOC131009931 [Salvia miltiorrhiza]|uniref:uncharacterized protein LOC131009931 n=1 Tax=Salvia miltiorrhiza TaxID=226208 RepID=UPI0025AD592B|nr:uncharacterized protein LOC131009931 [Salvia miltiorrhiza]
MENMKNHSDRFKHLKKITQILLPLSVFSLFLSHSSLTPLFLHSYDHLVSHLNNFNFKLFTYTTERNCIFLLCNGILVFIIQSSGLISKITPVDSGPKTVHHRPEKDGLEESKINGVGKVEILEEKVSFSAEEVEEDLQNFEVKKWDEHEHDEEDDEGIDTEELKKKCEDFIKKVKMEIQGA